VLDGIVCWRVHSTDEDVLAMNDYDDETGEFMPSSFIHVSRKNVTGDIMYMCNCSMFRWIHATITSAKADVDAVWVGIEGTSCMHCRFVAEEFEPRMATLLQNQASEADKIYHKLLTARQWLNIGVVLMSLSSATTLKFSVCSSSTTNASCSFVHLSKDGLFIRCQSGECQASQGAKKKPQFLLSTSTRGVICCHLEVMRANAEQWQSLCRQQATAELSDNRPDEDIDDGAGDDDNDEETGGSAEAEEYLEEGNELTHVVCWSQIFIFVSVCVQNFGIVISIIYC